MNLSEFNALKLFDSAKDSKGRVAKIYDIDRATRSVKTSRCGGCWRHYRDVKLVKRTEEESKE